MSRNTRKARLRGVLGMGLVALGAAWLAGCAALPPPITAASPKANVARAIERAFRERDTVFVLPTWVDYEKRGLWLPRADSTAVRRIASEADGHMLRIVRQLWQKEVVLVSDPVQQSLLMGDTGQVYLQLGIEGFSRSPTRRILSELKSFLLMGPTLGYNMNSPINTSSDMVLLLLRGGPKTKTLLKQQDEDDLDPADPADLSWQVQHLLDPSYRG